MRGRPARTAGLAVLTVLATTLTATLAVAVAPARALGPPTGVTGSAVSPGTLQFGTLEPGETATRTATLTTDAPAGSAFVRAVASGTGALAEHLTTAVESCTVAWTAAGCAAGGVLLLEGPVGTGVDATLEVPVPTSGVVFLQVSLAVDDAAPPRAASTVSYELHLLGPDDVAPPVPPGPGPAPGPGPLPVTGAEAAALGAAALALTTLGVALRAWVRERRSPAPARARVEGWVP